MPFEDVGTVAHGARQVPLRAMAVCASAFVDFVLPSESDTSDQQNTHT